MAKKKIRTPGSATNPSVSSTEERTRKIAEAAYYRALQRGFQGGNPIDDWLEAERELTSETSASPAQSQA